VAARSRHGRKLRRTSVVRGVAGNLKDLTDSLNFMAGQFDAIRFAVSPKCGHGGCGMGALKQSCFGAKGESPPLAYTDQRSSTRSLLSADQVTTVAREVGVEGKLGARRTSAPPEHGLDLTDNVNQLAGNLFSVARVAVSRPL